jgi:DNA-binding XRE family transcriptional regulator
MIPISIERGDRKLKMLQISMAAARVNANMTQDDIAREMHISKQTVINWEKGRIIPNIAQFEMYCRLCGISKDNIFLPTKST